jgi:hypothetical protein
MSETTPGGKPILVPYDTLKGVKLTDPDTKKTEFCYKADEAMHHRTTIKSFTQGLESFGGITYEIRICGFKIRLKSKDKGADKVKILEKSDTRLQLPKAPVKPDPTPVQNEESQPEAAENDLNADAVAEDKQAADPNSRTEEEQTVQASEE